MPKRGELRPMDEFEETIRASAVAYNIVCFQPGTSSRVRQSEPTLEAAKAAAITIIQEDAKVRSTMIYAIDEAEHHALVGTISRDGVWKPVVAKRY